MEKIRLCFATNNAHKLEEVRSMLPAHFSLVSLKDIGCNEELPENQQTIEGNALEKARFVFEKYGVDCFADDTGLEIEALDGKPGVDTAHYAGPERDALKNMDLALKQMEGKTNRKARFKTVFSLFWDGDMFSFEGLVPGTIGQEKKGNQGFGYDPIFIPDGFSESFAELGNEIKNRLSHRAAATKQLLEFLSKSARK
jgi:XTP/dITP diphosphohydrolase